MKNINPVNWFDITVQNLDRSKKFYESVFLIKLQDFPIEWGKQSAFPSDYEGKNISGALVENKDMTPNQSNTIIYFSCEDCSIEESRIEKYGGKVIKSKMNIGEFGYISLFLDTEGNTIGLHSLK